MEAVGDAGAQASSSWVGAAGGLPACPLADELGSLGRKVNLPCGWRRGGRRGSTIREVGRYASSMLLCGRRAWRNGIMVMPMIIGARPRFYLHAVCRSGSGPASPRADEPRIARVHVAPPARLATAPAGARGALRRPLARQRRHSHFARCEDGAEPLRFTTLSVSSSRQQRAWQLG